MHFPVGNDCMEVGSVNVLKGDRAVVRFPMNDVSPQVLVPVTVFANEVFSNIVPYDAQMCIKANFGAQCGALKQIWFRFRNLLHYGYGSGLVVKVKERILADTIIGDALNP